MDPRFSGLPTSNLSFDDQTLLSNFNDQNLLSNFNDQNLLSNFNDQALLSNFNEYPRSEPFADLSFSDPNPSSFALSSSLSPEGDDSDFSDSVLKYINQVLMEEDMETKPCMFHDPLALQAAEKSLYEVLGEKYPSSPNQHPPPHVESPDDHSSATCSDFSGNTSSSSSTSHSFDSRWINVDLIENKPSILQNPIPENFVFQSTSKSRSQLSSNGNGNGMLGSYASELRGPNFFSQSELVLQFNRGVEEANKFLPRGQLTVDVDSNMPYLVANRKAEDVVFKTEKDESKHLPTGLRGKKNHVREDTDMVDERSNKHSAIMEDTETELAEDFDRVLLCGEGKHELAVCPGEEVCQDEANKTLQQNGQSAGIGNGKTRAKNQGNTKEVIDLRTLLILCAQAVSSNDRRTANELLKQIRQHSSPLGDGAQRLAHCFANGLEARLSGTGTQLYTALFSKKRSAADMLKCYQAFIAACPFTKFAIIFANHMILKSAEKAETLHIIDFGILYGFQWPAVIQCLSRRDGGPPKLRITGIELPQSGFRPAERVQSTGHRLEKYCARFGVPFEFNPIAKKWETIQIEDLKLKRDEVVAVNCMFRLKNLLDETVVVNSPRDAVLNLIRKMNPNIFVHNVINGSYHSPFFVTRFREALFHFSLMFDMLDTNIAREDPMRLMFEEEFVGREAVNSIACEGSERVVRPETYKQWQVRNMRAGLKQLPLDRELMNKLKAKVKLGYHPDFVIDQDGHWMLQGWKGRINYASSCWVPS